MAQDFWRDSFLCLEPSDRDFRCPVCFGLVFGLVRECGLCTAFYCEDHPMACCGVCRQPLRNVNAKTMALIKQVSARCSKCDAVVADRQEANDHHMHCVRDGEGQDLQTQLMKSRADIVEMRDQLQICVGQVVAIEERLLRSNQRIEELEEENERLRKLSVSDMFLQKTPDLQGLEFTYLGRTVLPASTVTGKIVAVCGSEAILLETRMPEGFGKYYYIMSLKTGQLDTIPYEADLIVDGEFVNKRTVAWRVKNQAVVGLVDVVSQQYDASVSYRFRDLTWTNWERTEQCEGDRCFVSQTNEDADHVLTRHYGTWTAIMRRRTVEFRGGLVRWQVFGTAIYLGDDAVYLVQAHETEGHLSFTRYKIRVKQDHSRPEAVRRTMSLNRSQAVRNLLI